MGWRRELEWQMRVVADGVVSGDSVTILVGAFNFETLEAAFIDFRPRVNLCGGFALPVMASPYRSESWSFLVGVSTSSSAFSSFYLTVDDLLAPESIFIRSMSLFGTVFYEFMASVYCYSFV